MGTQATATINHINEKTGEKLPYVTVMKHFDGNPDNFGYDIFYALHLKELINGIPHGRDLSNLSNGIEDLSAQFVSELKQAHPVGNVYLVPPSVDYQHEYNYHINYMDYKFDEGGYIEKLHSITVTNSSGSTIFSCEDLEPADIWSRFHDFCLG